MYHSRAKQDRGVEIKHLLVDRRSPPTMTNFVKYGTYLSSGSCSMSTAQQNGEMIQGNAIDEMDLWP